MNSIKNPRLDVPSLNVITTLINQLVTTCCGLITPRILIGAFGSEAYGIAVSIAQFLSYITLLEGGIGGVARAELYGPLVRKDTEQIGSVYYAVKRFFHYVATAFAVYSVVLGIVYHDLARVTIYSKTYIFLLVLTISLSTLAKYMGGLANLTLIVADKKQYINNYISIGITLANTISVILLVLLKCDLIWVKLGSSLIYIVRPLLYSYYVKKYYQLPKKVKAHAELKQRWTGMGQHFAYFLHKNTDVVLLTLLADVRHVAVYSVYNMVINSIRSITEAFSGGMEAVFGELIAKDQPEKLRKNYYKYQGLLTVTTLVLFCCTGILIIPFVKLYTQGITDANYIQPAFALVFLLAEAVNCLALPCSSLPVAANQLQQTKWGAYGEAIINVVLSCILIRWEPLLGVALGTLAATVFRAVFYMVYSAKHILRIPVYKTLLPLIGTLSLLCSGVLTGAYLLRSVRIENYVQWIACGAVIFVLVSLPVVVICIYVKRKKRAVQEP